MEAQISMLCEVVNQNSVRPCWPSELKKKLILYLVTPFDLSDLSNELGKKWQYKTIRHEI